MRCAYEDYELGETIIPKANAELVNGARQGQLVAIKKSIPALPRTKLHLQREIAILNRLNGEELPYVVEMDGFGPVDRWTLFLATKFHGGGTFADIDRGMVPSATETVRRMRALGNTAESLNKIHQLGYIHGDVKSANILSREGVLIDFGGSMTSSEAKSSACAAYMQYTPGQCAPETYNRKNGPEADCWGLACTAFSALTGIPAYEQIEITSQNSRSRVKALAQERPRYRPEELNPLIPSGVSDVIYAGMSPRLIDRPSAEEVHAELCKAT